MVPAVLPPVDWSYFAPILGLWVVAGVALAALFVLDHRASGRDRELEARMPAAVVYELDEHRAARERSAARLEVRNGGRW